MDSEIHERASRYEILAAAAADLRIELGREPTVREIYAAVETNGDGANAALDADEVEADRVVDLRARIDRIVGDLASPLTERGLVE
jgi:hypothetical protein